MNYLTFLILCDFYVSHIANNLNSRHHPLTDRTYQRYSHIARHEILFNYR